MRKQTLIYFCDCCNQFYNELTGEKVHVPYSEMPADFAMMVMLNRHGVLKQHPNTQRKQQQQGKRKQQRKR
jgi:hypothetical protein